jgi:hypothetical protein
MADGSTVPIPGGEVTMTNIKVARAAGMGFSLRGGETHLDKLVAKETGDTAIYIGGCGLVEYGELSSLNSSKTNPSANAMRFEGNERIEGAGLTVTDDQTPPTGYKLTTSGEQSGTLGEVRDQIANGDLAIENPSNLDYAAEA